MNDSFDKKLKDLNINYMQRNPDALSKGIQQVTAAEVKATGRERDSLPPKNE